MLSKEEIENMLNKCDACKLTECIGCDITYTDRKQIREYIDQLEAREQKLTEKLEEKISFNKSFNDCTYCNNTCNSYATCEFAQKILEILKGEKKQ